MRMPPLAVNMWDFVVVGAGPAGCRFAERAKKAGYDVLQLEQGTVGTPLACSGHVSHDIWQYVDDHMESELRHHQINGARFHLDWDRGDGYLFHRSEPVSVAIDRVGLDRHLADKARTAGVDLREEHTVIDIDEQSDSVKVTVQTPDGQMTTEGRMIIGCDGPNSRVRSAIGVADPDRFVHGVFGHVEASDDDPFVDVHLTVPGLFAWRIPRGDAGVEYGVAVPPGTEAKTAFDQLCNAYEVTPEHTYSGVIPIGPPSTVTGTRGALIGDAAGQTKPFTGGGILYGLQCADHAARTIDPWDPKSLQRYESAWRADIGREIQLGTLIRYAYTLPDPVQRIGLRATAGEIGVHMDRPSTLFSKEQLRAFLR